MGREEEYERGGDDFGDGGIVNRDAVKSSGRSRKVAGRLNITPTFRFDYKDVQTLKYFITDRGKIMPRRMTGLTSRQQRDLVVAIKRARNIAFLPFTVPNPS
jgi:small subunit ribosomal protein S18